MKRYPRLPQAACRKKRTAVTAQTVLIQWKSTTMLPRELESWYCESFTWAALVGNLNVSMHLVFRDLDKVHVIQHLRLQGDGNDGEEEAEKQADVEVEPPKDQDSKLEKKVMMYKLRLLGVHAEDEKSKVIADVPANSLRQHWPFWRLLEFLRWVGFKRGWIGAIDQCRDGVWRRPHSMRAPKQLCFEPVIPISPGFAMVV